MTSTRFASIVITTFNRVEMLQESIASLKECTYFPHEIVIHDDGSDKPTTDMLYWLLAHGEISELILNPPKYNRGQALSMDRGCQLAQGDFIVKMEGDEQYTPGWLTKAIRAMDLFPEVRLLSLQQFWHTEQRYTPREHVTYPQWDALELASLEREGSKISVVWCSPGGQFIMSSETYHRFGPLWHGHAEQETIEFRAKCCPMFRLLPQSRSATLPAVTDKAAHWDQYRNSAWLAVLDPPVVSSHWGVGKGSLAIARNTLKRGPKIFSKPDPPTGTFNRGTAFGPMKGYNMGKDLDRYGVIK